MGENIVSPVQLSDIGLMVDKWWKKVFEKYNDEIEIDEYVIMPNHLHAIIKIIPLVGAKPCFRPKSVFPKSVFPKSVFPKSVFPKSVFPKSVFPKSVHPESVHPKSVHPKSVRPETVCQKNPPKIKNTYAGIGKCISWFKRMATNEYIRNIKNKNWQPFNQHFLQRNYYEHIIRDEKDLSRIREYIINNPSKWEEDQYFEK